MRFSLSDLDDVIGSRTGDDPEKSYTAFLLQAGVSTCAQKVGEEATETVIAAIGQSDEELIGESADLLYHLLVLLRSRGIGLDQVLAELERRTSRSGHEEKAARKGS